VPPRSSVPPGSPAEQQFLAERGQHDAAPGVGEVGAVIVYEIATGLVLSPLTKTHVSRTMTRLAARDRAQLVVLAYQTGLVTPDRP